MDSVRRPNDSWVAAVWISVEMMIADEIVRAEESKTEQFIALGLGRYEAIRAVEEGIDWSAVETLVRTGCPPVVSFESAR